jgi:hypothetical protein
MIEVIFHFFLQEAITAPFGPTVHLLDKIQHKLGNNGPAGPNCTVLTMNLANCGSSGLLFAWMRTTEQESITFSPGGDF